MTVFFKNLYKEKKQLLCFFLKIKDLFLKITFVFLKMTFVFFAINGLFLVIIEYLLVRKYRNERKITLNACGVCKQNSRNDIFLSYFPVFRQISIDKPAVAVKSCLKKNQSINSNNF